MHTLNEAGTLALVGSKRTTMHRKIASGQFPAPIKPDGWHVVWRVEDVDAWLLNQAVVKDAAALPSAEPADLLALASTCDPALVQRVFPSVAALGGAL